MLFYYSIPVNGLTIIRTNIVVNNVITIHGRPSRNLDYTFNTSMERSMQSRCISITLKLHVLYIL